MKKMNELYWKAYLELNHMKDSAKQALIAKRAKGGIESYVVVGIMIAAVVVIGIIVIAKGKDYVTKMFDKATTESLNMFN